jgi:ribosomal protein L11 methyltransferase
MAYELLIQFVAQNSDERVQTKARVIRWLEAIGRSDFVEGVIDGIESAITDDEKSSGLVSDDRFDDAPLALFDEHETECALLLRGLEAEFGSHVEGQITEISDDSWAQCWRDAFVPLETRKFYIVPLSSPTEGPRDKIRVEVISRHDAFGTGQHATTRAVIKVLEERLSEWRSGSLLDIGTGTGIYLVLAGHLGVTRLVGSEISEDLAAVARENCQIAGVAAEIFVREKPNFHERFDVIVANILAPVLYDLMPDMVRHLASGGRLVLAGFIEKEAGTLIQYAESFGLKLSFSCEELGWKCVVLENWST